MYLLIYQDYTEGPMYLFSKHHQYERALRAKEAALADPWWGQYIFTIHEVEKAPQKGYGDLRSYVNPPAG